MEAGDMAIVALWSHEPAAFLKESQVSPEKQDMRDSGGLDHKHLPEARQWKNGRHILVCS